MKEMRKGFMFWVCILALLLTIAGIAFASQGSLSYKARCTYGNCKCTEFRSTFNVLGHYYDCYNCGHRDVYHKR